MKIINWIILLTVTLALHAQPVVTISNTNSFVNAIPAGNPVGVTEQFTVGGGSGTVTNVTVQLDITGGFNGDLYAYLVDPAGQMVVLLNRSGVSSGNPFGYSDGGFNITLDGQATNDVHYYQNGSYNISSGQLTGTWAADGRNINPQSIPTLFGSATSTAGLNLYIGQDGGTMNGTWILFVADLASGGGSPTIQSAVLSIMTVPEPNPITLTLLGGVLVWVIIRKRLANW